MAKVFGLVNSDGLIVNAFYWNQDPAEFSFESFGFQGCSIVRIDEIENCGIGWSYIDGEFIEPIVDEVSQPTSQGAQEL